jgi:hypothetical protein
VIVLLLALAAAAFVLYRTNLLHRWLPQYPWLEHVSAGFDGPVEGFAGGDPVVVTVGSGAAAVEVKGLDGIATLPVDAEKHTVTVPMDKAAAGRKVTLTDDSLTPTRVHDIEVKKKP